MSEQVHVNKQDITNIANAIRTQKNEPASKKYKVNEMDEAIGTLVSPTGTINITANGTVDVANYAEANVNVSSEPTFIITNCEQLFSNNRRIENINSILPNCKPTNCNQMFNRSTLLTEIPMFDTSACNDCSNMFDECSNLRSIPQINLGSATSVFAMFNNCANLVDVPELDFKSVNGSNMNSLFYNCSSLSDESLNNIMISVIKAPIYVTNRKTLSYIGLSSSQATRCQSLSNYQAFLNAGWSTGY